MALYTVQSATAAGTTPTVITPTASDTISAGDIGTRGVVLRVVTTGTSTNVTVTDPGTTSLGNPGTATAVAVPSTGTRYVYVGPAAVNAATQVATVTYSGALTGVSVEAIKY